MKHFILPAVFIMLLAAYSGKAQTKVVSQDSIIKESSMNPKMWKAWYSLDSVWTRNIFPSCLLENHLKLSCGECEKVYMVVQMKIDSAGKLASYKKIKESMCGSEFSKELEKSFFDFFFFIEFPADFRNTTIEVRLGDGLKC